MTIDDRKGLHMKPARAAAVVTWSYAAGFGVPTVPVAVFLLTQGRLPSFLGLFDMYGGPWSARLEPEKFVALLGAFLGVMGAAAWSGWLLWRGRKAGAVLNLALLPVEAIFWLGFALPIPWLVGASRAALVAIAWTSIPDGHSPEVPSEAKTRTPPAKP
jgi:hypothetical protein